MDACGCELILSLSPRVRRGAVPIADVADEIATLLVEEGEASAWRRLLDFVDDFRASPIAGKRWLVEAAPALCGDRRLDAAIAALAEFLCVEAGLPYPTWTDAIERFAQPWWFVSGLRGFEAMALRDSPIAFARHGVFVNEGRSNVSSGGMSRARILRALEGLAEEIRIRSARRGLHRRQPGSNGARPTRPADRHEMSTRSSNRRPSSTRPRERLPSNKDCPTTGSTTR